MPLKDYTLDRGWTRGKCRLTKAATQLQVISVSDGISTTDLSSIYHLKHKLTLEENDITQSSYKSLHTMSGIQLNMQGLR